MPIKSGGHLSQRNIYIDYPFEKVMFRRTKSSDLIYKKFYGEDESEITVSHHNKLLNDALLYGTEITKEEYESGKKSTDE